MERDVIDILTDRGTYSATISHSFCFQGPDGPVALGAHEVPHGWKFLCTSEGPAAFTITFARDQPIYMATEQQPDLVWAVCKGSSAGIEMPFSTQATALPGCSPRRCQSAPPRCPEKLCLVRLRGRTCRDPTAEDLLKELSAEVHCSQLLSFVPAMSKPSGLKPQHIALLASCARQLEKMIEEPYKAWRGNQARYPNGPHVRAPRLQFLY